MDRTQISQEIDTWIAQAEIASHPSLKPVSRFDGLYPDDPEEYEAYWNFINWCMNRKHAVLDSIPAKESNDYFFHHEPDEAISFTFSSANFRSQHPSPYNAYHWRLKKIFEKVKDLAETHSCICHREGKDNVKRRYVNLVENEFRDQAVAIAAHLKKYGHLMHKEKALEKIKEMNSYIKKCKYIWMTNAYQP